MNRFKMWRLRNKKVWRVIYERFPDEYSVVMRRHTAEDYAKMFDGVVTLDEEAEDD